MLIAHLYQPEIALAIELRSEGVYWTRIAEGLGVDARTLKKYVREAEQYGAREAPEVMLSSARAKCVNYRASCVMGGAIG